MKVLFVGLGSIGKRNLDSCLRTRPTYEFAAWKGPSSLRPHDDLPSAVRRLQFMDEVIGFGPDIIWICNPTALHRETLQLFSNLNCAFFLEKPLAHLSKDVEEMQKLVKKTSKPFFYGCILRHHPLLLRTKEILLKNLMGKAYSYEISCGSYLPSWRPQTDYRQSYSARPELGGGVSLDLIHEFDYAEFFFGPLAQTRGFKTRRSDLEIKTDDLCCASIAHENGVVGQINLNYFRPVPKREFEIQCAGGFINGNLITGNLSLTEVDARGAIKVENQHFEISRDDLHDRQTKSIFNTLEGIENGSWNIDSIAHTNKMVIDLPFWNN